MLGKVTPSEQVVLEGSTAHFQCYYSGEVIWYFYGTKVQEMYSESNDLIIANATSSDEGVYTCHNRSTVNQTSTANIVGSAELRVRGIVLLGQREGVIIGLA